VNGPSLGRGRRDPASLRSVLDRVANDLEGAPSGTIATIMHSWVELVGPDLAAVAQPGSLAEGVLTVVVDEPAVATALRHRAAALRTALEARCGPGVVHSVQVRVRRR
jgi:predicted nucleic acid-binding Zn ribbon protein